MTMPAGAARKLVLVRHAKSAWPDVPDHERPLARRGQRNAPAMGRWLRTAGHLPDRVLCSTARRARETWQLMQSGLQATPPTMFDDGVDQASAARLLELIRQAPPPTRTLLVVGHDPAIQELALARAVTVPARPARTGDDVEHPPCSTACEPSSRPPPSRSSSSLGAGICWPPGQPGSPASSPLAT